MNQKINKEYLVELGVKLERIISRQNQQNSTQVIEILKLLESLQIDPLLIRNAKIIFTINNLRKSMTNEEVIRLSKKLLISWKNQVMAENNAIKDFLINTANKKTKESNRRIKYKNEFEKILSSGTNNEVRIKSRHLLSKALMVDNEVKEDILTIATLVTKIEKCIFQEFKETNTKYRARIRSRVSNLRDQQNSELRINVLKGRIKAEEIAKMGSEEMATDWMKQLRQQLRKESMSESLLPEVIGTTSDLLKCPKCKKNNCTYNQVQIERADEPMTTFCLCISCGHRWKFN